MSTFFSSSLPDPEFLLSLRIEFHSNVKNPFNIFLRDSCAIISHHAYFPPPPATSFVICILPSRNAKGCSRQYFQLSDYLSITTSISPFPSCLSLETLREEINKRFTRSSNGDQFKRYRWDTTPSRDRFSPDNSTRFVPDGGGKFSRRINTPRIYYPRVARSTRAEA